MNKKYKKIIVILASILLTSFLIYCIFIIKKYNNLTINSCTTTMPSKEANVSNEIVKQNWSTYHDERYGFKVDYPSNLYVTSIYNHKERISNTDVRNIDGGVFFSLDEYGGGGDSLAVYEDTKFSSLEDWLAAENKRLAASHYRIDARPTIGVYQAISAYEVGDQGEDFKNQRLLAFFRDKQLFVISTGSKTIYDKILTSLKFDK